MEISRTLALNGELQLESGVRIQNLYAQINYWSASGCIGEELIWVFHPLTASSNLSQWWPNTLAFLQSEFPNATILCVNTLGGCYGSTGPENELWNLTILDQVKFFQLTAEALEIRTITMGLGSSLGGQQLIQWIALEPQRFQSSVLIATNAEHSPWGRAWNASQRHAILRDETTSKKEGLAQAREIGMLSYRTPAAYNKTQRDVDINPANYRAETYQSYQGQKLADRFDAYSYYALTMAMDSQNVWRKPLERNNLAHATTETLIVSVSTDTLFPPEEQIALFELMENSSYASIESAFGHDGFLADEAKVLHVIKAWIKAKKITPHNYPIHNEAV